MAPTEADKVSPTTSNEADDRVRNDDKATEPNKIPASIPEDPTTQVRDSELPVVNNVFYNEETLKYMKIIDMYKRMGIGKDIELPRVK
jgi:hypothetical protein